MSARLGQEALAREIAAACCDRGAHHVQVDYSDPWVSRARFQRAPEEALGTVIPWVRERPGQMAELQAAWIGLTGPPVPGVLDNVDPARIGGDTHAVVEWAEIIDQGLISWTTIPGPTEAWAKMVYADRGNQPLAALWRDIADICRLDEPDPAAAWRQRSSCDRPANGCSRPASTRCTSAARAPI